jgi:hypothetical protein
MISQDAAERTEMWVVAIAGNNGSSQWILLPNEGSSFVRIAVYHEIKLPSTETTRNQDCQEFQNRVTQNAGIR